ncbi:TlpA family protein disulfide reductase [Mucilaginibacter sp. UR6-1]|uniref:DUF6263 family protein n=1 Tax=Mucilaginibacter sp. UR6-1 TaxID=1435643 RepID=UPI001E59D353|nr:DUF6263 family protein [Mucilaginibacter sp. UR6-1]MCC8410312.1 TlpA family protein disulfide reductase [Mucilaginibacter sp. UR6-1]
MSIKPIKACLLALSLFVFSRPAEAQVAKPFTYTYTNNFTGTFNGSETLSYHFTPVKKNSDGSMVYDCRLIGMKKREDGKHFNINTDNIRETELNNSGVVEKLALLNMPFRVTVDKKGIVQELDGIEEIAQSAKSKWYLRDDIHKQFLNNYKEMKNSIQALFLKLPDQKITYGTEWTAGDNQYKVVAIKGVLLDIAVSPVNSKAYKKFNQHIEYNDVTDLIQKSTQSFLYIDSNARPVYKNDGICTQQITYNAKIADLDTPWINMAVKMSYWSEALKKGTKNDSAKTFALFKIYDPSFKNDAYYCNAKLSAIQRLDLKNNYELYDSVLMRSPNHIIDPMGVHFFNKLGNSLTQAADSTYSIIKYFHVNPSFGSWIQESLAQSYLNDFSEEDFRKAMHERKVSDAETNKAIADHKNKVVNALQLIDMMNTSKLADVRQKSKGLYIWVKAKAEPNNKKRLLYAAHLLENMDDATTKASNGGRYAMLIYNMLYAVNEKGAANTLLNKTIAKLEKYTADTLNSGRYAHQNLLAHAYYLKYTAAKPADSVKALQYLAKAAQYSPKSNKEKAYTSFYDRVFLKSQESYREEFIDRLFKTGDKQQALAIFAEHVNVNPERLDEMERIYATKYPDKAFKTFFANNVVTTWQRAPDFVLKDIEGKEHNLSAYRDKWLVLDFWGTWCGPCREEMPKVNAFNDGINRGEYAGVNFLSIACNDTQDKVKAYLAENKFTIPVLMSDQKVEKTYKIRGYPSKILISPDGKMININFGADWLAILKKFNQLYASN